MPSSANEDHRHELSGRFVVSSQHAFRVIGPDAVVAFHGSSSIQLPLDVYRLLLEFTEPRSVEEVHAGLAFDGGPEDLAAHVEHLESTGLLRRAGAPRFTSGPAGALASVLNREIFGDPGLVEQMGSQLKSDRLVVIDNAFERGFAERIHQALDASERWRPYEGREPFFHFRHHNLYAHADFPSELVDGQALFGSDATKHFVAQLTDRDCSGELAFGASLYLPGDYSLPHQDVMGTRTVAFVWHLTRSWRVEWGGDLVWCPTGTSIAPAFNRLMLFRVGQHSLHFVAPVSAYARGKRMAVNGWWTSASAVARRPPTGNLSLTSTMGPDHYGTPRIFLGGRQDVVVL